MKNEKLFKWIFWLFTALVSLFSGVISSLFLASIGFSLSGNGTTTRDDTIALMIMAIVLVFVIIIMILVAILVFRDAKKLGLNPWLWTLVAVYTPNGVGIIIYLIVRYNETKILRCVSCGRKIESGFKVCPYCGSSVNE